MMDRDMYFDDLKAIDKKEYIELIEEDNSYREIDEFCDKLNRIKYSMLKEASFAHMGCVVESTEESPIIGTQALDTCYGILFYDRKARKGLVGHGSPSGKVGTLYEMMKRIDDGSDKVIEYMIVSGFRNVDCRDMRGLEELFAAMRELCSSSNLKFVPFPTSIKSQVRLDKSTLTYEFAFDTRNGSFVSEAIFFDETEVNPRYIPKGHHGLGK